jgi:hypothetical protein
MCVMKEQLEALGKPLPAPQTAQATMAVFAPRKKALLYSLCGALVLISAILIALIIRLAPGAGS